MLQARNTIWCPLTTTGPGSPFLAKEMVMSQQEKPEHPQKPEHPAKPAHPDVPPGPPTNRPEPGNGAPKPPGHRPVG